MVFWPVDLFFLPNAFFWNASGTIFGISVTKIWTLQEPKKGTKMDPRIGPALWKTLYSRANWGSILGPSVWRPRAQSHSTQGETGVQPFCKCLPAAGRSTGSEWKFPLLFHGGACGAGGFHHVGSMVGRAIWKVLRPFFALRLPNNIELASPGLSWPFLVSPGLYWPLLASPGLSWLFPASRCLS